MFVLQLETRFVNSINKVQLNYSPIFLNFSYVVQHCWFKGPYYKKETLKWQKIQKKKNKWLQATAAKFGLMQQDHAY